MQYINKKLIKLIYLYINVIALHGILIYYNYIFNNLFITVLNKHNCNVSKMNTIGMCLQIKHVLRYKTLVELYIKVSQFTRE